MKIIDLIEQEKISGFEVIPNVLALSVFIENESHAIDADTSNVQAGTPLVRIDEYSVADGILTVGGVSLSVETSVDA